MSVQFGRWHFEGQPAAPEFLEKVSGVLAPYGPDRSSSYSKAGVDILCFAFHTTKESRQDVQPHVLKSGAVLTWDGRVDNRTELIGLLGAPLSPEAPDLSIVAVAYERWGTDCLGKLIGEWALSVWNPHDRSLVLAKDPIGTRHLFYSAENDQITWSTVLDPLVLFAGRTFELEEEYIAGWLGQFPATHLTPYAGIHSVPPSCLVRLGKGSATLRKYWDFDPYKRIRYRSDAEYEEHFRAVFGESVRRRLRSDAPILAELSGGMDSSSIVCMADTIIAPGAVHEPGLETVSYYDDSEPNWNEKPFFNQVEQQRGRTGWHIDVGSENSWGIDLAGNGFAASPSSGNQRSGASAKLKDGLISRGNRVLLSGIGGDEVTGGVPTPIPELADLIAGARLRAMAHQLKVWALDKRKPWFHLLFQAASRFFPAALVALPESRRPAPWLGTLFVRRHRAALRGYQTRLRLFGPLPSFQENLSTLDAVRRQLGCLALPGDPPYEKRYPYLDRDLLEFLFATPREQMVRPGQRRSLVRRALTGIVPSEILNRRRKAFVARSPMRAVSTGWSALDESSRHMLSQALGVVDSERFREGLERCREGREVHIVPLLRTLGVERWLRSIERCQRIAGLGDRFAG